MVIFVDRSANRAKRIVAVGHRIGNGELAKTACSCCLYNANVGYIVRNESVKFYAKLAVVRVSYIVRIKNGICNSVFSCFGRSERSTFGKLAINEIYTV